MQSIDQIEIYHTYTGMTIDIKVNFLSLQVIQSPFYGFLSKPYAICYCLTSNFFDEKWRIKKIKANLKAISLLKTGKLSMNTSLKSDMKPVSV